ncbi:radical SAM protein [Megasphaera stantonii]|uniref:radical SAM protein n=1 Tax=Megasphaera stantonii TaxID=2144175 RepID=UPI00320B33D4
MYYKFRNDVLFRKYKGHGYITDNSEYGYRMLNDNRRHLGEKYVSSSGAIMLNMLSKSPRNIDDIVSELLQIFIDVEYETLKQDTSEFFNMLVDEGFLSRGKTIDACIDPFLEEFSKLNDDQSQKHLGTDDCNSGEISPNEFLRSIHIEVSNACNERCIHCYIPNEYKNSVINSALFYRIVEEGRKMNIIHVTLSGGEPLLHKDILGFLEKCRMLDLSVNVLSNLTLLTDDIILEMKKNPFLSVQASLYSMNATIHDSITGLNGSFEKTSAGILQLCDEGIPVQISCPIIKQNKNSYVEVLHWGWKHNIAVAIEPVIFAAYDHSGCNLENRLSIEEMDDVLTKQVQEGYAESIYKIAKDKENLTGNDPVCSVCRYSFCVTAEGQAFPCAGWQNNIIGDLNYQSVQEIWESSKKIQELRKIKRSQFLRCVDCIHRGYCTVCMMWNSNENSDGDPFKINEYRCEVAAMLHCKIDTYLQEKSLTEK